MYKPARAERHRDDCGEEDGESSEDEVRTSLYTQLYCLLEM